MRDEQRRRRSQYDRGTSLAEREEFGFGEDGEFDLHIEQQINGQGYPCESPASSVGKFRSLTVL